MTFFSTVVLIIFSYLGNDHKFWQWLLAFTSEKSPSGLVLLKDPFLKLVFWGQHYPDTTTCQEHCKKRKWQAVIYQTWKKSLSQNIRKSSPAIYRKGNISRLNGIYPRIAYQTKENHLPVCLKAKRDMNWSLQQRK